MVYHNILIHAVKRNYTYSLSCIKIPNQIENNDYYLLDILI